MYADDGSVCWMMVARVMRATVAMGSMRGRLVQISCKSTASIYERVRETTEVDKQRQVEFVYRID